VYITIQINASKLVRVEEYGWATTKEIFQLQRFIMSENIA